jgi:flagellar biogenesis protein FliO
VAGYLVSTTAVLALLCVAALLALRGLRGGRRARVMKVRERLALDGRRAVYLVEVAGRCLVVGAGEGGLSTLAEVDPSALPADEPTAGAWAEAWRRVVR